MHIMYIIFILTLNFLNNSNILNTQTTLKGQAVLPHLIYTLISKFINYISTIINI